MSGSEPIQYKPKDLWLKEVRIQGILSFGEEQVFEDLKKFNVLIGANSSGKSNFIRAITFAVDRGPTGEAFQVEIHHNLSISKHFVALKFANDADLLIEIKKDEGDKYKVCPSNPDLDESFKKIKTPLAPFRILRVKESEKCIWDHELVVYPNVLEKDKAYFYTLIKRITETDITEFIPYECKYGCTKEDKGCPNFSRMYDCGYYRLNNSSTKIPIDLLGWGTKSIVMMIYQIIFDGKTVFFMEEPELSVHPKMLRNLLGWLASNKPEDQKYVGEKQFFFSTHSSWLLDDVFTGTTEKDRNTFYLRMVNGSTKVINRESNSRDISALQTLGYSPSNLMFSNFIIWVEGPSDVMYYDSILKMISFTQDDKIVNGQHYSIIWYGGKEEGHLFDISDDRDVSMIFSFMWNGGIFCDGDQFKSGTIASRFKVVIDRIKKYKDGTVLFGVTGEISKDYACRFSDEIVSDLGTIEYFISHISDFRRIAEIKEYKKNKEKGLKPEIEKIEIARDFKNWINDLIENNKKKDIERILEQIPRVEFFKELYKKIIEVNK